MAQCQHWLAKCNHTVPLCLVLPTCLNLRNPSLEDSTLHRQHSTLNSVGHGDLPRNLLLSFLFSLFSHVSFTGNLNDKTHRLRGL